MASCELIRKRGPLDSEQGVVTRGRCFFGIGPKADTVEHVKPRHCRDRRWRLGLQRRKQEFSSEAVCLYFNELVLRQPRGSFI